MCVLVPTSMRTRFSPCCDVAPHEPHDGPSTTTLVRRRYWPGRRTWPWMTARSPAYPETVMVPDGVPARLNVEAEQNAPYVPARRRSEERRVGKECRSRWS